MSIHENTVVCPTCFEEFTVSGPAVFEVPTEWDYDCEICCRPMIIRFFEEDGEVRAEAFGIHE
ncbi:MAG: CPXCG motif-containing cysteine-rich protein [Verrucomicrobiota bacterium]